MKLPLKLVPEARWTHDFSVASYQQQSLLQGVLDTSVTAILVVDLKGRITFANDQARQVLGLEPADITCRTYNAPEWKISDVEGQPIADEDLPFSRVLRTGAPVTDYRHAIEGPDGRHKILSINGAPLPGVDGEMDSVVFSVADITESYRVEALRRDEREVLERMLQGDPMELVLRALVRMVERDREGVSCRIRLRGYENLVSPQPHSPETQSTVPVIAANGLEIGAVELYAPKTVPGTGEELLTTVARMVALALERQSLNEQMAHQASHDSLIGLPNRYLLMDRLERSLPQALRDHSLVALLLVDLDRFKEVNDSLGHPVGDALLQRVAERFRRLTRSSDTLARMGGDEFVLVLPGLVDGADAAAVAQKLSEALQRPLRVGEREIFLSTSIGISVFPQDAGDAINLLRNAESALYRAKEDGGACFRFFATEMAACALYRFELEQDLRRALERNALRLRYQPQVCLASGAVVAYEALLHWEHPRLGVVPPPEYVPLAERSGLIVPLGNWVVKEACRQLAVWHGEGRRHLRMAVNVSPVQFVRAGLVEGVQDAVAESGILPQALELEVTEGLFLQDTAMTERRLRQLKEFGVGLSIDDFGTGYCSLAYLRRLPIDRLKIDRSFIAGLLARGQAAAEAEAVVLAIITLAHSLKLRALAEGVEQPEQLPLLKEMGCDEVQGFHLGRPQLPELQGAEASSLAGCQGDPM
jgi:diguanylate cyclase (GGDEF)-like protein/PAS domain S-box-containing protein